MKSLKERQEERKNKETVQKYAEQGITVDTKEEYADRLDKIAIVIFVCLIIAGLILLIAYRNAIIDTIHSFATLVIEFSGKGVVVK